MKSLAIWTKSQQIKIKDLHINIWKLPWEKKKKKEDFYRVIDFGIKFDLSNLKEEESKEEELKFNIFYPQRISCDDVEDLVGKLYENFESKLISTLFNDNLSLNIESNNDYAQVKNGTTDKDFFTYKIKPKKINFINKYNGTILEFKIRVPPEHRTKIYVRFRIKKDYSEIFSTIDRPSNAVLQSKFSKTELFNFRINEVRDISNEVLEEINTSKFGLSKFEKIHVFYICSAKDEYMYSHKNYDGVRVLERSKWNSYIDDNILNDKSQILAYHFKEKYKVKDISGVKRISGEKDVQEDIVDYNFLIQTKYEINNRWTIFYYLGMLFFITLFFNLISNAVWENFNTILNTINFIFSSLFKFILNLSIKTLIILLIILVLPIFILNLKRMKNYGNNFIKSIYDRKK